MLILIHGAAMIDDAETGQLQALLAQIGMGLDNYLKFIHDDAYKSAPLWQAKLNAPLPDQGIGINALTDVLINHVIAYGSPIANPGFSSYITTGATTAATLASTAANIASPQRYHLNAFNYLEELSLNWLAQMLGLTAMKGVYSSGGSVANLVALGAARQFAFEQLGQDVSTDGVNRACRIYASEQSHHTIARSAAVLGLGRNAVKLISCDDNGCMRLDALRQALAQDAVNDIVIIAIVANAGTTNTGVIDPLQAIGEIARQHQVWYHIDGAYGLPGILDPRLTHLYQGLSLADSVIVDPHKWLGASVGVAATFVKNRQLLQRAFTQEPADYLEGSTEQGSHNSPTFEHSLDDFGIPYFDYGVELSSPARGVVVWALIKEIGVNGMRKRIVRHNDMARYLADAVTKQPNLELLATPVLSICCFRYINNKIADLDSLNQQLHRQLIRENIYMPSTTKVNGVLALRPCYVGARSNHYQLDGFLRAVLRIGAELTMHS